MVSLTNDANVNDRLSSLYYLDVYEGISFHVHDEQFYFEGKNRKLAD
jgi:hypothetical protein